MRVTPLVPAAWLTLAALPAAAQPAEAPQRPSAPLAPSISIHDGDTSIDVQCSVRDTIAECTDAVIRLIDRLNGTGSDNEAAPTGASDISG